MTRPVVVRLALALTLVAVGSLFVAAPADAHPSHAAGRLTFMRQDALGHWQVWVANADLSAARQLTFQNADSGWPVWSPNGRKIAFESNRTDTDPNDDKEDNDVYLMNPDGSSLTDLTASLGGTNGDAGWSPDGRLIAFESDRDAYPEQEGIHVMRADGSHVRRLTTLPAGFDWDGSPRFSPDGRRLVFTRFTRGQGSALFTTDLQGNTTQITPYSTRAGDAVWSPKGNQIVFEAFPEQASTGDVYVVNADGKHLRNLTHYAPQDAASDPVWSPDGRQILFLQVIHRNQQDRVAGLAVMRSDGSDRHFLEDHPIESHQPDWIGRPGTRR